MHLSRSTRWIILALVVLVGFPLGYYNFLLDWQGRPFCHKQIMFGFKNWMTDPKNSTNTFPNVGGASQDSLAAINDNMNSTNWSRNYRYVPGLCENDPGHLVLMYVDRPTRWTWHGPPPTIFEEKKWILVPVDFATGGRTPSGPGELSERVSTEEFKKRLRETIEYVRTNERPNWQTVVAEQSKFLQSIEPVDK